MIHRFYITYKVFVYRLILREVKRILKSAHKLAKVNFNRGFMTDF